MFDQWEVTLGGGNIRVLQMHTDVSAQTIGELAWRPSPLLGRSGWTLDVDLFLGEGDYANRTSVFLDNFASPPARVVTRRAVSWPAWPFPPVMLPRDAFVLRMPLDRPWVYSRARDLIWMLDVHISNGSGGTIVDGAARLREDIRYGTPHGTGCYNTWNNALARISAEAGASRSLEHRLSLWCDGLRPNSLTTILLGGTAVAQRYPFLCGFQYVDSVFFGALRVADSVGAISRMDLFAPYQASAAGLRLHGQAFCLDDGRHPMLLPVTMTNGVEIELPEVFPAWHSAFWAADILSNTRARSFDSDRAIVTIFR